ncbi:peptidylglycine alpha-amidating monooxygenase [Brachionus plicatilis]|uniref:peptidylamidoglycolate lyase n=1 Tax=Brachionus plicatilis TaxID=10195 RepID=A0A3M7RXJ2_BRAPC|nr:peptidylglycine alpha-amidating monooxygenase [Brachionus plicatilis]
MLMSDKSNEEKQVEFFKVFNPSEDLKLQTKIGQVGGLDTNMNGNLVVFHRGSRVWQFDSFMGNNFNKNKYKAIKENTLTLIDVKKSEEIFSWGANRFYMPHGLTIDFDNNIWVTDVALHQVMKFNPRNLEEPELVLGVEFKPGNAENQFCKPTDVSVSETSGHVFISDGYCNHRVVEFDKSGHFLGVYEDKKHPLQVVHSVALVEKLNLVCTVSRQDDSYGFTFYADESRFGQFKQRWNSLERDLEGVHDIALSPDGSAIYLGQLNGEIDEFTYE